MTDANHTIVCLGELLIDFVPETNGQPLSEVVSFRKAAGGAPANVAAAVAKLGGRSRFIGKVGRDPFGEFLRGTLTSCGVEAALAETEKARTGLAFVSLKEDGERDFLFYREPAADMLLEAEEIQPAWLQDAAVYHYGSVSLIAEPCRTATLTAAQTARENGAIVSYDPNIRLPLWGDAERARREILAALPLAQLVKVSEEEVAFLCGTDDLAAGARELLAHGPSVVVVTLGSAGCRVFTAAAEQAVPGFAVDSVDATGAGDGFVGGLLYQLARRNLAAADLAAALCGTSTAVDVLRFANAVGALATTRRGAIASLPTREQVEQLLRSQPLSR
jgi:fructokinase